MAKGLRSKVKKRFRTLKREVVKRGNYQTYRIIHFSFRKGKIRADKPVYQIAIAVRRQTMAHD